MGRPWIISPPWACLALDVSLKLQVADECYERLQQAARSAGICSTRPTPRSPRIQLHLSALDRPCWRTQRFAPLLPLQREAFVEHHADGPERRPARAQPAYRHFLQTRLYCMGGPGQPRTLSPPPRRSEPRCFPQASRLAGSERRYAPRWRRRLAQQLGHSPWADAAQGAMGFVV